MSNKTSWRLAASALTAAVVLAGCGSSDALGGKVVKDGLGCSLTEAERATTDVPKVEPVAKAPKDLVKKDLKKGKGCGVENGSYVTLDLVGATAADAKVFTDTFADERPVTATLGSGQLLSGLENGLEGLKVGGRRQITLPADQAYGKDGNFAQGIGPDQALVFVVDLVGATDAPIYCNAATSIPAGKAGGGKPTEVAMPVKAPTKLVKADLQEGTGDPVDAGNYVTLNYLGVGCSSGQQFDSSWDRGETLPVTLGEGTIPGFSAGIEGMKVGGLRRIEIPAADAYGAQGGPTGVGPNDPLVFVISVVTASKTPPTTTTLPAATPAPADGSSTTAP